MIKTQTIKKIKINGTEAIVVEFYRAGMTKKKVEEHSEELKKLLTATFPFTNVLVSSFDLI